MPISAAREAQIYERCRDAIRLKNQGFTYAEIAPLVGFPSAGAAQRAVHRHLQRLKRESLKDVDEAREAILQELADLRATLQLILERDHVHVSASGKIVRDDNGEPLIDDGPTMQAADRILKIIERKTKLLGLDAPQKVESDVQVNYTFGGVDLNQL